MLVVTAFHGIAHRAAQGGDDFLKPSGVVDLERVECIRRDAIVTSELSVHLFLLPGIGGGLAPLTDYSVVVTSARGREWSAKTDKTGFVRIPDLQPGNYQLHVPYSMESLYQEVRIAPSSQRRTIAAIANFDCGRVCVVPFETQRAKTAPPCLFKPPR